MRSVRTRFVAGLLLGLALMAWFLGTLEWSAFLDALLEVHSGWVLLAALVLLGEFLIRALRWRVLLRPLSPRAALGPLLSATIVGGAVNTLLPARAGDVARPLVAQRRTGIPLGALVATNVVERVFDLVGMLSVLLLALALLPEAGGPEGVLVANLRLYGLVLGGAGIAGLIVLFALARRRSLLLARLERLIGLLPRRLSALAGRLLRSLLDGMTALERPGAIATALLLTLLLWFNGALSIFVLFQAFDLGLPFGAAAFTAVALALTVVLPQAPGFVGVFHVAIEKTMVLWGLGLAPAKVYAVLLWGVSFLPVTAIGLVALWREGLSLGALLLPDRGSLAPAPGPCHDGS